MEAAVAGKTSVFALFTMVLRDFSAISPAGCDFFVTKIKPVIVAAIIRKAIAASLRLVVRLKEIMSSLSAWLKCSCYVYDHLPCFRARFSSGRVDG